MLDNTKTEPNYITKVPDTYSTSHGYLKPIVITLDLLNKLKKKEIELIPGQWLYSKRDGKKVKFVHSGLIRSNGIVKQHVFLSYPKRNETILEWNKRFSQDLARVRRTTARLSREPRVNTKRKVFVREPEPERKAEPNKLSLRRTLYNNIKIFFANIL